MKMYLESLFSAARYEIVAFDKDTNTATLQNADGKTFTVKDFTKETVTRLGYRFVKETENA
jgi:hypothetical protein